MNTMCVLMWLLGIAEHYDKNNEEESLFIHTAAPLRKDTFFYKHPNLELCFYLLIEFLLFAIAFYVGMSIGKSDFLWFIGKD